MFLTLNFAVYFAGVSEDALKEFSMMFKHFDKDRSGRLNHHEFKSCLRALGYDLPMVEEGQPDPEFEAILSEYHPTLIFHTDLITRVRADDCFYFTRFHYVMKLRMQMCIRGKNHLQRPQRRSPLTQRLKVRLTKAAFCGRAARPSPWT